MHSRKKVAIYITRRKGRELELLTFTHRDIPAAGVQVPAGTINPGEDERSAAKRELREESGLEVMDLIHFGDFSSSAESVTRQIFYHHLQEPTQDHWSHVVSGNDTDHGLVFEYSWHPLRQTPTLAGEQGLPLQYFYQQLAPDLVIRMAVPGEEAAIHEAHMRSIREICIKDHGAAEIRGWGHRPLGDRWIEAIRSGFVWVAEYRGTVQGVASFQAKPDRDETLLHALYVTPDIVGRGVGKAMAELVIDTARRIRKRSILLMSSITAREFYQQLGFVEDGDMERVEIGGYPVTCFPMRMALTSDPSLI